MTLEERIMQDLKTAMKDKDQATMRAIRAIKAALLNKKTDGSGEAIDEKIEIQILQKLVKSRKESLGIYEAQNRKDLAAIEAEEISVIERYLPEQLSPEEIEKIVDEIIAQTGASSMRDMGKVMGMANSRLAGRADGKTIASLVKNKLQS